MKKSYLCTRNQNTTKKNDIMKKKIETEQGTFLAEYNTNGGYWEIYAPGHEEETQGTPLFEIVVTNDELSNETLARLITDRRAYNRIKVSEAGDKFILSIVYSLNHDGLGNETFLCNSMETALAMARGKQLEFCEEYDINPEPDEYNYLYTIIDENNSREFIVVAENEDTTDRMYLTITKAECATNIKQC